MMIRRKVRLGNISTPHTDHSHASTLADTIPSPLVGEGVDRPAVFGAREPFVLPRA